MERWAPGTTIVHHEVWAGRVWAARPLVVVEDADDRLLLWIPHGTRRKVPTPPPDVASGDPEPGRRGTEAPHHGVVENLVGGAWTHMDHVWDVSSLWLVRPGDGFAVWTSWEAGGDHLGWYVNIQRPYRRTATGIEAMDLMLDIVVDPDRTWRWKDRHELDELARRGTYDEATLAAIAAAGDEALALLAAGADPFTAEWATWRPDPTWGVPELPPDWDVVPEPRP